MSVSMQGLDKLRYSIQARLGAKMTMSSTLVETVSINFEDFNESFLTCGTCLCMYDGGEHNPKLLPCSHTVCRQCLERIVASATLQSREAGTFRCPICRETITLPRGGVNALPPSFLVNQLLDLMMRQRREVIPKCSQHPMQELLFCETCDTIFCTLCPSGVHGNGNGSGSSVGEHTVIPFSIAIKRMSEILLYKAHQCVSKLSTASDNVTEEIHKLDHNVDHAFELVNKSFQEALSLVEKRRLEVLALVKKLRDEKKKVLQEQLTLIETEKEVVEQECEGLQYQVEVRNITKKISDLNAKLDSIGSLNEPRENAYIKYDYKQNSALSDIQQALGQLGKVLISKTYPALCTAALEPAVMHLATKAVVTTVDYHGDTQTNGGDPLTAKLRQESGDSCETHVKDNNDGTYYIMYTPPAPGFYQLDVTIFDRPIKGSPFKFTASDHINPVYQFGSRGSGRNQLMQPVSVVTDKLGQAFVMDTGNSRITVLNPNGQFVRHIEAQGIEERSGTGIAMTVQDNLVVVNWRTKCITELTPEGRRISQFTYPDFVEPIDVAVNSKGDVLVADNGLSGILVFDKFGKFVQKVGSKGNAPGHFGLISSVASGRNDEILVADSRIQIFSRTGEFLREINPDGKGKGKYGGVVYDGSNLILATRTEKTAGLVQVFTYEGQLRFSIDSHDAKLKRPCGLSATGDGHVVVVDLGNDCVKKYRYK